MSNIFFQQLDDYIRTRLDEFDQIPDARREEFAPLVEWIVQCRDSEKRCRLNFICTHNSRRSHLAQIWAGTAAAHAGLKNVETWSGGTEATAFHPNAVHSIKRCGFEVSSSAKSAGETNPEYLVRFGETHSGWKCFSKVHDQPPNPTSDFAAILVCDSANAACPVIAGADLRVALPYIDPKISDGTDDESATYDERCRQIAREMLFAFCRAMNRSD